MTEIQQLMDPTYDEMNEIEKVIERELRPRLQAFGRDVELLNVSKDGTAIVVIKKVSASLFNIRSEILEKIVVSKIKLCLPHIRKVVVNR